MYMQPAMFRHSILLLSGSLFLHLSVQAALLQQCTNSANYTSGSQFQTNLNLLLQSLLSNAPTRKGFFNTSVGADPNKVYGLAQCSGDLSTQECQTCLYNSTLDARQLCPNQKEVVLRHSKCILHYSNSQSFSQVDKDLHVLYHVNKVPDTDHFNEQLSNFVNNLSTVAASRPSRFDYGITDYSAFAKMYGMVNCIQVLSPGDCLDCLRSLIDYIPICCYGNQGGHYFTTTCDLRFEIYPFFSSSITTQAPPPVALGSPPAESPPQANTGYKKDRSKPVVVATVVPTIFCVILFAICAYFICKRRKVNKERRILERINGDDPRIGESVQFELDIIRTATNDFSEGNKLGEGGFGVVYKGKLVGGQEIAVKRLSRNSRQGSQEFRNEVVLLLGLQHRNLVRLLGFCLSGNENLLIYEYVPNKSLDKYIFDPTRKRELNWEKRYTIILGIARGLLYLHEDSRLRIIHRDLKAGNVLLDSKLEPKIADFGMAKLFGVDQTGGNTSKIAGTLGYIAPEYAFHGLYSVKSDVFSFGVLLLEIISGQSTNNFHSPDLSSTLLSYTWQLWREGNALRLIDQTLVDNLSANEAMRCIHIALLCVQQQSRDRPNISSVVAFLDGSSQTLQSPSAPAFQSTSAPAYTATSNHGINCSLVYSMDGVSLPR